MSFRRRVKAERSSTAATSTATVRSATPRWTTRSSIRVSPGARTSTRSSGTPRRTRPRRGRACVAGRRRAGRAPTRRPTGSRRSTGTAARSTPPKRSSITSRVTYWVCAGRAARTRPSHTVPARCGVIVGHGLGGVGPGGRLRRVTWRTKTTLELHVLFPDCWDGKRLDSPDHQSHMAYSRAYPNASWPIASTSAAAARIELTANDPCLRRGERVSARLVR